MVRTEALRPTRFAITQLFQLEEWLCSCLLAARGPFLFLDQQLVGYRVHEHASTTAISRSRIRHLYALLEFKIALFTRSESSLHGLRVLESQRSRFFTVFRLRQLAYRIALFRRYNLFPPSQRPFLFIKRAFVFVGMSFGWHKTLNYYRCAGIQEDHFYGVYAPLVFPGMRWPSIAEAAAFSIETNFRQTLAYYVIGRPFGCHAWETYDRAFWVQTFPEEFPILRAPRIISNLQGRCGHEKAAEEAAEQENLISTIVEII